jgi:hypothetical protein
MLCGQNDEHFVQYWIDKYNWMCDLHFSLYMFLYVYVAYLDNVAAKS